MGFKIGTEVICVNDSNQVNFCDEDVDDVVKGNDYIIKGYDELGGYLLKGMCAGYFSVSSERGWKSSRFRKVEPKSAKNEISAKLAKKHLEESEIIKEVDTIDKPNPVHA